ncbi:TOG array regulator of axonemal microtubules protein 2 [Anguilla anguilla]|uniref:TOG array regulator of axonemal microtubules protein 2 n=1 Tax=Anguilla anguilla TaxID=7936 RepID=UPI0015B0DABC|nr:TOG array regulator of axonemal microtubules protein 2 [Anguilla anguilla]
MACKDTYVKQLMAQMGSKCIQKRISAINQLVDDCILKPGIIMSCIFPVFDTIRARLVESNRMVNLHMLKALGTIIPQMKERLHKVVFLLIPAIVDNHLNSKTNAIYSTALAAIRSVVHNLDNSLLLEILVTKAQLISGNAKTDLTDTVAGMVMELYPRRPKMVEQQVLPLLWHMLAICSRSAATVTLFRALYSHMGPRLWAAAACQPLSIRKGLQHLLSSA